MNIQTGQMQMQQAYSANSQQFFRQTRAQDRKLSDVFTMKQNLGADENILESDPFSQNFDKKGKLKLTKSDL